MTTDHPTIAPKLSHPRDSENLRGHGVVIDRLLCRLVQGNLPTGLLFDGPKGVGKATCAYHLIHLVMGGRNPDGDVFRSKPRDDIYHRMAAGTLENFFILEKKADTDGKQSRDIPLDDFKKAVQFLHTTSFEGRPRFILIDGVDDLPRRHANVLLKSLEEPPPHTHFILIAHQGGRVLPTLRSRLQMFSFQTLNPDDFCAVMAPLEPDAFTRLFSDGSPGLAMIAMTLGGDHFYDSFLSVIESLHRGDSGNLPDFVRGISDHCAQLDGHSGWHGVSLFLSFFLNRWMKGDLIAPLTPREGRVLALVRQTKNPRQLVDLTRFVGKSMNEIIPLSLDAPMVVESILWRISGFPA